MHVLFLAFFSPSSVFSPLLFFHFFIFIPFLPPPSFICKPAFHYIFILSSCLFSLIAFLCILASVLYLYSLLFFVSLFSLITFDLPFFLIPSFLPFFPSHYFPFSNIFLSPYIHSLLRTSSFFHSLLSNLLGLSLIYFTSFVHFFLSCLSFFILCTVFIYL